MSFRDPDEDGRDPDKRRDTPLDAVHVHGIRLESRYNKQAELAALAAAVSVMGRGTAARIESVMCDGKAGAAYIVQMRSPDDDGRAAGDELGLALKATADGHNGITVYAGPRLVHSVDPDFKAGWDGP